MASDADSQADHPAGAGRGGGLHASLEGLLVAGDDHLAGGVVAGDADVAAAVLADAGADVLDLGGLEPQDGRHAARATGAGIVHELAALLDQQQGLLKLERAGGDERAELAQAVAGDEGRLADAPLQRAECGHTGG